MSKRKVENKSPGQIATLAVTQWIGCHGLHGAYDIACRAREQVVAHVKRQIEKHPEEWDDRIKREVGVDCDVPPCPDI